MSARGAEFADLQPRDNSGSFTIGPTELLAGAATPDMQNAVIQQMTPNNAFRPGQQVLFWLGVYNEAVDGDYLSSLRLKPWWARQNMEYRQAGAVNGNLGAAEAYLPVDAQVFGGTELSNNRLIWVPSPKRLDITEYQTPPPVAAVPMTSDSLMLDDVWKVDLQDATDADYLATFQAGQAPSRWMSFLYPAMGYALGFTYEATYTSEAAIPVKVSLSWTVGTLGGSNYQESIG